MIRRSFMVASVLAALVAVAACGGGGDSSPSAKTPGLPSAQSMTIAGSLILTRATGIAEIGVKSHDEKTLIKQPTADTFLLDPAVSADGAMLTYVVQPPPKVQGNTYDAGSDLWVANRDGSAARAVFTHVNPNQLVRFPQWLDAGHVLAIVQEPNAAGGTTSVTYFLERIDIGTGERAQLIRNALTFGISPDRTRIAYTFLAPGGGETLDSASVDGSGVTTLVGSEQHLLPFNSPRFSPDGAQVAFTSADQTGARADVTFVSAGAAAPAPDGLPEDVWTVDASGGQARRVADLKEDLPAVTWGGDSKHLYVLGSNGLSDVNLTSGAVTRIGEGSFHGQIAWAP